MAPSGAVGAAARKRFSLSPYSYEEARALCDALGLAEPVATTLVRRGYRSVEAARAFLEASEEHDPSAFAGMDAAVERIRAALASGIRITVHGDYDVDGVCATAILVRALRELGGECDWYIPDRLEAGYGLTSAGVELLAARGTELLITVDCGITCAAEVAAARQRGIDVIVTDHHQPGEELPQCPVLHPEVSGYPCTELCAAGVAYKLAAALLGPAAAEPELDLVALATVADLVPLRGENRALVRRGLAVARRAQRLGLRALLEVSRTRAECLDEGDFAFRLAPRINAAGRLYRADAGVELLLSTDADRARAIAEELDRANRERRTVEREVLAGAERALRELPEAQREAPGLVLAGEGWHPGVVGIVASRLAERLWRPVVLLSLEEGGGARGSGRSIPGFDLLAALRACDRHLARYGGHRAAAGVELETSSVQAFRAEFAARAAEAFGEEEPVPTETVDAVVGGESLGHDVAEQLARLAPFGAGNPGVRLLVPAARLGDVRPMGEGDRHARFSLRSGQRGALGVAFGVNGELAAEAGEPHDVSVKLELNEWNGAVEPRVVLGEIYPREPDDDAAAELDEEEFWARFDAELAIDLDDWPPGAVRSSAAPEGSARTRIDRRAGSGVAAIAALASTGEPVLCLSADAMRRRELVERAVRPARFGGGEVALVSMRQSLPRARGAVERLLAAGSGVALADWQALSAWPELGCGFAHLVVVDPASEPGFDALAGSGDGYLHLLATEEGRKLAARACAEEWPDRDALGFLYRALRRAAGEEEMVGAEAAFAALRGAGSPYPRSPEAAARRLRILLEVGLVRRLDGGADRSLMVVSSSSTDLERSAAFGAYRRRRQEAERYLSEATQSS